VGLFFASEKGDDDGVLWATSFEWFPHDTKDEVLNSFPGKAFAYTPKHVTALITAQAAAFTIRSLDENGQPIPLQSEADLQSRIYRPSALRRPCRICCECDRSRSL
jgi:hypothetical protein